MRHTSAVPVIATTDVRATMAYYERVLDFRPHFVFGDPPVYGGLQRDGVLLYVTLDEKFASLLRSADLHPEIFLWVQDVDEAYAVHCSRGAKVISAISDRDWDARQYVLEDPNGYYLKIAMPIDR